MTPIIGQQKTGRVEGVVISGTANEGLRATWNGKPARIAVVADDGTIIDAPVVAVELFAVSVNAYRDFLRGEGHLRTHSPTIPK